MKKKPPNCPKCSSNRIYENHECGEPMAWEDGSIDWNCVNYFSCGYCGKDFGYDDGRDKS